MAKKKDKSVPLVSFPTVKRIRPKTIIQNEAFKAFHQQYNLCLHGQAGTGKTFLSLFLALDSLLAHESKYEKVIIIRSVVPTREIGFLPGSLKEKVEIYEHPYREIAGELFEKREDYDYLKAIKKLDFQVTSHLRGLTFSNAIIVVDEIANMTYHELCTIITRVGENCRIIFVGDSSQSDLRDHERDGLKHFLKILKNMPSFHCVEFTCEDIVRGPLVKEFLMEQEAYFKDLHANRPTWTPPIQTQPTVGA